MDYNIIEDELDEARHKLAEHFKKQYFDLEGKMTCTIKLKGEFYHCYIPTNPRIGIGRTIAEAIMDFIGKDNVG